MISESNDGARQPLYRRGWFLVALAISVAVLMRLPGLEVPLWNVDEASIATIAAVTLDGGTPYRDWVDHRAPLSNLVYVIVFLLFGRYNMIAIHGALLALVVVMVVMVFRLGLRLIGRPGAAAAAFLFAVLSSAGYPASDLFAFNAEWGMALSVGTGMLLLVGGRSMGTAVAAGSAFACAVLFKQPAVFDLLAAIVFLLFVAWRPDRQLEIRSTGEAVRRLAAIAMGGVAVAVVVVGVVLSLGVWREFFFYSVTYNTEYYAAPFSLSGYLTNAGHAWIEASRPVAIGWLAGAGGLLMVVGLVRRSGSELSADSRLHPLLLLWACGSFLGVAASGRVFPHYFIQLLLPWTLLAGFVVREAAAAVEKRARGRMRPATGIAVASVVLLVATAWFVVVPWRQVTPASIERQSGWVVDGATVRLAEYLESVTTPEDGIFVWGFYPIPYVLADRLPGSRFLIGTFVTGANVGGGASAEERPVPGAMEVLLRDLQEKRPAYIIDTSPGGYFHWSRYPPERYPELIAYIESEYLLDRQFSRINGDLHFRLFRRRTD